MGVAVLAVGAAARSRGVVEMAAHADGGRRAAAPGEAAAPGVPRVAAVAGAAVAVVLLVPVGDGGGGGVSRCEEDGGARWEGVSRCE